MSNDLTLFLGGDLRVHQPSRGYRFNVDSVLLAGFARALEGERVLDLGTGSGILLLLLKWHGHPGGMAGVELQPGMAELARRNMEENGYGEGAAISEADLRVGGVFDEGSFGLVVSNPPYHRSGAGLPSPDPSVARARHDEDCSLPELFSAAARALSPRGRFCFLAPSAREGEALEGLHGAGLAPSLLRRVRPDPSRPPHIVLIQARLAGGGDPLLLPDLCIRGADRVYNPEVRRLLNQEVLPQPRFFCDAMLGTLARYLRLMGLDAAYSRRGEDAWLLTESQRSGRVLLTRDRPLLARSKKAGARALDPGSDAPLKQLAEVLRRFPSAPRGAPPRCLDCNAPVLPLGREQARGRVPPYTLLTRERFQACPTCGKLTWEGSHLARFKAAVAGFLPGEGEENVK